MRNDYYTNSKDYINRWVISYADFVTMLLALFVVLYAMLKIDNQKMSEVNSRLKQTFSNQKIENVTKYQALSNEQLSKLLSDNLEESNAIKVFESDKGAVIRLNNKMLFGEGQAEIKPEAQKTLNDIQKVLTKIDNPVIIEGHTDSTPIKNAKYPSNWELSTARATNIISYFVKQGKISPKRLSAVGCGEYSPISNNTTIGGRNMNRRVDIIVLEK